MNTIELRELEKEIYELCMVVGKYQVENLDRRDLEVKTKSTAIDVVTEVDLCSEEMIISFIKSKYPEHNILAEESGEDEIGSEFTWIIDPVDGTRNYAHGYPLFAISIGLKIHDDMILGCIYLPALDLFYSAIKGEGAYCNGKSIKVSDTKLIESSIIATGFPFDKKTNPENNLDYFSRIMPIVAGVRRSGSACVDLVNVAHGRIDAYFEMYLNQWDIRPGILIIEEAGGKAKVNKHEGSYSIVVSNGVLQEILLEQLNEVNKGDY